MMPIPAQLLAEFAAAVELAQQHRATLVLELTADGKGNVRVRLEGIRGVSCAALVGAAVDRDAIIERT